MLYPVTLLGSLGVIKTLGCSDKIAGNAAYPCKLYRNPPEALTGFSLAYAVKFGLGYCAAALGLNLLYLGKNEAFRKIIGIDDNCVHNKYRPFMSI